MFAPLKDAGIPSLSPKEAVILRMLVTHGDLYGLGLVEKSDGQLKRGTVYVTLDRMEDKGFVISTTAPQLPGAVGLPKRLYSPTGLGRRVLDACDVAAASLLEGMVLT
jgi:PadR family transcriptional regulator PadR